MTCGPASRFVGLVLAAGAAAPASAQDLSNVQSLVFLTGTCERLVIAGRDATADCRGTAVNLNYRTGRTSFAFQDGEARMVSFTGLGAPAEGDVARHALDGITIAASPGPTVTAEPATGSCEYSNPYRGRSYIRCAATTAAGAYSVAFASDGRPPQITEFPPPAN